MGNKFTRKFKINEGKDESKEHEEGAGEKKEGAGSQEAVTNDAAGAAGGAGQSSSEEKEPEAQVKVTVEEVGASDGAQADDNDDQVNIKCVKRIVMIHI